MATVQRIPDMMPAEETRPGPEVSILIVDDRRENLVALEAALAPLEHRVVKAASGEQALRCLLKEEVAVIILDVQMPGLDGFETAAYIKELERTKHIPIIFLTAINKEAQHVFRGYSAGAVDYLFKPFEPEILRSKVSVFIDLHEKSNELRASAERFRRSFDHAPIGMALVSLSGSVLKVNKALEDLTGLSQAELAVGTIHDLLEADGQSLSLERMAQQATVAPGPWHSEHRVRTAGATDCYALVSTSFISSADGLGPHFIFQITDITERRELETLRERFIAHAAHELRTPATVIAGTATLLHDSRDVMKPADVDHCIGALFRQSQRLIAMVGNLLDLARLKEGRLLTSIEPLDLAPAVAEALEAAPPPSETTVEVDVADETKLLADRDSLNQILSNLLVNAYRYGGPKVRLTATTDDGRVALSVGDDGPGVPPDVVPRMFEPFTRGKGSSAVGGSGLGLALVKSLIEANGGEIAYTGDSSGACFVIRLPAG